MESRKDLSPLANDLLQYLRTIEETAPSTEGVQREARMSDLSRGIGALYEKLRFAVDNKEEQFFRRYAIRRALRRVSLFTQNAEDLLHVLISDLERGGYLTSAQISEERMSHARQSLDVFGKILLRLKKEHEISKYHRYRKHLLDIIAGALEDALYDTTKEEGIVTAMTRATLHHIEGNAISPLGEEKKHALCYVASWRSLFGADASLLSYKLWLLRYPDWDQGVEGGIEIIVKSFPLEIRQTRRILENPIGRQLLPKIHNLSIAFTLLYDLMYQYGAGLEGVVRDPELLHARLRECLIMRYQRDVMRARRRSLQSVLYIFITKSVLAVGIESLYVFVWKQTLNYIAVVINIVAHPSLLFFLTSGLRQPAKKNTERALALVDALVYGGSIPSIRIDLDKRGILYDVALGLYVSLVSMSVIGVVWGLIQLQFHFVDIGIFLLFLILVLYFGFRIRHNANRMRFSDTKDNFIRTLLELLFLPLVSVGRWMNVRFENINIALLFLDFFIEAPLRLVLKFFDTFSSFVAKKREEIYTP